ncbi:hypothetical protein FOZ61_002451 [Perkinsus olseni]|uniref:Uncharacterized protein n=1 Tax=Perkinsus olseni TaxID=32597 RepID=A0A7J6L9I7_PEROL|nr:hypothetical protein FOL46_008109 [Perkinsus olseni]KAF4662425.1 hypothetical protein FOZ61_002451 [Perkinsus olseni]
MGTTTRVSQLVIVALVCVHYALGAAGPSSATDDDFDLSGVQLRHPEKQRRQTLQAQERPSSVDSIERKIKKKWLWPFNASLNSVDVGAGLRSTWGSPGDFNPAIYRKGKRNSAVASLRSLFNPGSRSSTGSVRSVGRGRLSDIFGSEEEEGEDFLHELPPLPDIPSRSVSTEDLLRDMPPLDTVAEKAKTKTKKIKMVHPGAEIPAEVYCSYLGGQALCLAKLPDSDFTDIFLHDFVNKTTQTCGVLTFPSFQNKGEACCNSAEETEKAWESARKSLKKRTNWQQPDDQKLMKKFRHLIFQPCAIHLKDIAFNVTALYVKPVHRNILSVAFFTAPEKPSKTLDFIRLYPAAHSHADRVYVSVDPPFKVIAGGLGNVQVRAKVYVNGKKISSVSYPDSLQVFKLKKSKDYEETSKNQLFFFTFNGASDTIAVMKYGSRWGMMMSDWMSSRMQS